MNGVLMLSMESGMLLFSQEIKPSFGLSTPCDPYQQSGFLYALYSSASAQFGSPDKEERSTRNSGSSDDGHDRNSHNASLQWYTQDHVVWYFHEEWQEVQMSAEGAGTGHGRRRILTALSTTGAVSSTSAQAIAVKLSQVSVWCDYSWSISKYIFTFFKN
jgi:hypothetical protein